MSFGHNHEARSTNFLFTIGDKREVTFAVQTANIADLTLGDTPFPSGPKDLTIPSNKVEQDPLTFDMIVSDDYSEWIEIYKWMMKCKNNTGAVSDVMLPCTLIALDAQKQETVSFMYLDAFPTELSGVQYAWNNDASPVVTCTVTLRYNLFRIILPNGEEIDERYSG